MVELLSVLVQWFTIQLTVLLFSTIVLFKTDYLDNYDLKHSLILQSHRYYYYYFYHYYHIIVFLIRWYGRCCLWIGIIFTFTFAIVTVTVIIIVVVVVVVVVIVAYFSSFPFFYCSFFFFWQLALPISYQ